MGSFDSLYDDHGREWQTRALGRGLQHYRVGDEVPSPIPTCQIAVYTRDEPIALESWATIVDDTLTAVGVEPDPALTLLDFDGNATLNIRQVTVRLSPELAQRAHETKRALGYHSLEALLRMTCLALGGEPLRTQVAEALARRETPDVLGSGPRTPEHTTESLLLDDLTGLVLAGYAQMNEDLGLTDLPSLLEHVLDARAEEVAQRSERLAQIRQRRAERTREREDTIS